MTPRKPEDQQQKRGRKPTGRSQRAVMLPKTLVDAAEAEQERRKPVKASLGGIVAEWAERGRTKKGETAL